MSLQLNKIIKILRYLGLIIGLLLFLLQFTNAVIKFKENEFSSINWIYIVLAFLIMIVIYFIQVLLWLSSMKSIGIKISVFDALPGYWISFIPRYIPGTIWGYLSRSDWFFRKKNIPYGLTNTGSVIEALIVLIGGFAAIISTTKKTDVSSYEGYLVSILLILLSGVFLYAFFRWIIKFNFDTKIKIISIPSGGLNLKYWFHGVFLSLLNWILFGLVLWLVIVSMSLSSLQPINSYIIPSISIYSIAWLIGFIVIIIPGGLGIRESIMAILLTNTFSLNYSTSVTIAVIIRLISLMTELIWIIMAVLLTKGKLRKGW